MIKYNHCKKLGRFSYMKQIIRRTIIQAEQVTGNKTCLELIVFVVLLKSVDIHGRVCPFEKMYRVNRPYEK